MGKPAELWSSKLVRCLEPCRRLHVLPGRDVGNRLLLLESPLAVLRRSLVKVKSVACWEISTTETDLASRVLEDLAL